MYSPRLEAGARLWNSKAQEVQQGLAFLCLNLPPTTLLPSSYARCCMQGTSGRLPGPRWAGKERTREEVLRLCPQNRMGVLLGDTGVCSLSYLVRLGWAGTALQTGAQGLCPFQVVRSTEEGRVWQGESLFGQWAQSQPYRLHSLAFISSPGFMSSVQLLSAQVVPLGGADA